MPVQSHRTGEGNFRPIRLVIKQCAQSGVEDTERNVAIVAEDATGRSCGITADRETAALLEQFLPTSGPRFLEFWSTYESDRGGDCFFWDLQRLASAIASSHDLPALRKLSAAKTAADFTHNAYQASAMALAHRVSPGCVRLLRAHGTSKSPDFSVAVEEGTLNCEVKTITRSHVLDLLDEGLQIAEIDRAVFIQTLGAKIDEAFAQTGPAGVALVAVWCDSLGMVLAKSLSDWECSPDGVFVAGQVGLTCRDQGEDRWFVFPGAETPARLAELRKRLEVVIQPPWAIPLSGSAASVTNGMEPIPAGRVVAINNRETPTEYSEEQLAYYRASRPFREVPLERLLMWQARWRLVEARLDAYRASAATIERRRYSAAEWIELPAGVALLHWLACLQPCICDAFEETPGGLHRLGGVLADEYRHVEPALRQTAASFWHAPHVGHAVAAISSFLESRLKFAKVKRVTSGFGKLLQEELAARRADKDETVVPA